MVATSWLQARSPHEASKALAKGGSSDSSDICKPTGLVSLHQTTLLIDIQVCTTNDCEHALSAPVTAK